MATRIHSVQRAAYLQEAALLGVVDFAPAQRTTADVQISSDTFYGAFRGEELLGVISLEQQSTDEVVISSLTVVPSFQRAGVGRALVVTLARETVCRTISVCTGAKNYPALALYGRLGFVEQRHKLEGHEGIEIVELVAERSKVARHTITEPTREP
jgi:ribosomal protein S18 acetylase RimI-like enzyme